MITSSKFFNKNLFDEEDTFNSSKIDNDRWQPDTSTIKIYSQPKNYPVSPESYRIPLKNPTKYKAPFHTIQGVTGNIESKYKAFKQIRMNKSQIPYQKGSSLQHNTSSLNNPEKQKKYSFWLPKLSNRVSISSKPQHLKKRNLFKEKDSLNFIKNSRRYKGRGQCCYNSGRYKNCNTLQQSKNNSYRVMELEFRKEPTKYDIYEHCVKSITAKPNKSQYDIVFENNAEKQ